MGPGGGPDRSAARHDAARPWAQVTGGGAIRAAGLADAWSPSSESAAEMLDHGVDAISFTSAPTAASLLARADALGAGDALVRSLRRDVLAACVGPVAVGPLAARDVVAVRPKRARIGGLVRALTEELPARAPRWPVTGHILELRGHAVSVDGELWPVPPGPMELLRLFASRQGQVASRSELLAAMSGGDDEHAVETAVARLRTALGDPRLVQTVTKRGYRLALDTAL